jgi:DNA repair exonuclease SbcCD ATPase subunit
LRLHRLRVVDFAAIRDADIEFGPGLNVLYGPNDLGKSTLADAIRLALLLPHTSTHIEDYVPWTGGRDPIVEMTFEMEPERIWRVRKEFRKGGTALLQESKNGVDFDDVERARRVDGKLRDISLGHSRARRRGREQRPSHELSRDRTAVHAIGRDSGA